ncbi:MAG: alpha-L-fucosidase [Candidatus Sulfotelmatobacter sp.]
MQSRRDFCRLAAQAATLAALPTGALAAPRAEVLTRHSAPGKPLLQLQQEFLDLRFGMFVHFNMATFQDREWGDPTAPADQFNPTALDTDQWAQAAKSANMTWGCLTTKHHDGFCIWPTATRSASVRRTQHKTDIVRAYVDSFRKHGLKVALYYSMLDMREDIRHFNVTPEKVHLIKAQLTELFTQYGDIFALIIDGWNAPWSRITYEEIPFHEIYGLVKSLQPDCLVSDLNASQYPTGGLYYTDLKAFEQNAGQLVPNESSVPAYSCVTLTDGWFWKLRDVNGPLKATKTVVDDWLIPLNARHCNLILNAPPNRQGRLAPNLVGRLAEIGRTWNNPRPAQQIGKHVVLTTRNLATGKPIEASSYPDTVGPDEANDGDFRSTWYIDEGLTSGWLEVDLTKQQAFNVVSFVEPVGRWDDYKQSRIKNYKFQRWDGHAWVDLAAGGVPSPVTIHSIARASARRVRLLFESSRNTPHLAEIGVYDEPEYYPAD